MLRRDEPPMVFSGSSNQSLALDVSRYLNIPKGESNVFKFSNDNTFVQFQENIRQRDIFLIQPFTYPVNDHIMELLIMIDAAKRASAGRITAVTPYYAYGRTDKKDQPRVPHHGPSGCRPPECRRGRPRPDRRPARRPDTGILQHTGGRAHRPAHSGPLFSGQVPWRTWWSWRWTLA